MKKIILLACIIIGSFSISNAQITISPTNLFIDDQSRFGSYLVINGSEQAQEISVDFAFGYTKSDSAGNRTFVYDDSTAQSRQSAAEWVRAFPRNFTLQPGQRQTIRLRVSPPDTLDDGVYWAKIKTIASPQSAPIDEQPTDGVSARVGFRLEQVTGLYYKEGAVTTGIIVKNIEPEKQGKKLTLTANIDRTGNAPFLGTIQTNLYNQNNKIVRSSKLATTIYWGGTIKQQVDITDLPSGTYRAEMLFKTERSDIAQNELVQMPSVSKSTNLTLE